MKGNDDCPQSRPHVTSVMSRCLQKQHTQKHSYTNTHTHISDSTNVTWLQLITWGPTGNVGDNFNSFTQSLNSLKQLWSHFEARHIVEWYWIELIWIKSHSGESNICMFIEHACTCVCLFSLIFSFYSPMTMPAERQIWVGRKTTTTRHLEKTQTYQYDTCKQEHL